jgi:hypothetical protein
VLYNRGVKRKGIEMKKPTSGVFEMMNRRLNDEQAFK